MQTFIYYSLLALGIIIAHVSVILFFVRTGKASQFENAIYFSANAIAVFLLLGVVYWGTMVGSSKIADLQVRRERLDQFRTNFRRLLLIAVPTYLFILAACVWLLLTDRNLTQP